mgnify:CR=1 FL=1
MKRIEIVVIKVKDNRCKNRYRFKSFMNQQEFIKYVKKNKNKIISNESNEIDVFYSDNTSEMMNINIVCNITW